LGVGSSIDIPTASAGLDPVPLPSTDSLQIDFSSTSSVSIPLDFEETGPLGAHDAPGDEIPFSDDFGEVPPSAPNQASGVRSSSLQPPAQASTGFDFVPSASAPATGFDFDAAVARHPDVGASAASFALEEPPGVEVPNNPPQAPHGFSFDALEVGQPSAAPPQRSSTAFDFSPPPTAAAPSDDLAFDFNEPPPPRAAAAFGEVDLGSPSETNELEFDPTRMPARSGDRERGAPEAPSGPVDGLEMLSFIDDTAKEAQVPSSGATVRRFHIKRRSGKVFGPFEEAVVVKMLEEAQLLGNEEVSQDTETWQPIGSEPAFQAVIAKLMEAPARTQTQSSVASLEDKPKGPSMEKLKQLYEGRMAAVAVVETKAPVPFSKRVPSIVAGLAAASVIGVGVFSGVATPYGFFFLKRIFPAKIKVDTREYGYLSAARAGFLKDTFKSYTTAKESAEQALAVKEYPEARAVWSQAVYSLHRKYRTVKAQEVEQADAALSGIELLGEKHVEVLKAKAQSALVKKDADAAIALVSEALAREENQDDLELPFLRAEAYLVKKSIGQARSEYEQILKRSSKSARALHALANLSRQQNDTDEAMAKYEAALAADPEHVASGIELAELLLVEKREKQKGEAVLAPLLSKEKKALMGPTELGKTLALQAEGLVIDRKLDQALALFDEALKADPKNAFAKGRMAKVHTLLNQPEKALPLYRDASTAIPESLEYTEGYLSNLLMAGKMDEATKVVASANARFPGNAVISYLSGRVSDALDDSKAAEEGYKRAIAANPSIAEAYLYLSRLYTRFRRYGDALPVLEQGLEKAPQNAALHVGMGELALNERNLERATAEFKKATEIDPLSSEAFRGLSRVSLDQGKPDLALAHIEKATEISPRVPGGRLQKGIVLWKLGRLEEATQELEKAREEEPRNVQVVVTLGAVELEQNKLSNAMNHLLTALQTEPGHPDANFYMARVRNASRNHSQAVDSIKRALENDPKNPTYRYWFGRILTDARKGEEAVVELKMAVELNPKYADALETLGRLYVDRGQLKDAVEAFTKALAIDPARNTARAAMGDAFTKLDDYAGAVKAYTQAIEADPDNPGLKYAYARLASAYRDKTPKDYKKASEWYQRAIKIDPTNFEAYKDLGYLLKDLKRPGEAIAAWREYLKITTDDEKTKKVVEGDLYDLEQEQKAGR
jgi:tetratricopeptide (TPR) repeat protein